jgi:uncharacterized protein
MTTVDELRQVIRRIEARYTSRPAPEPIEKIVGGEIVDTGTGPLLVARHEYPLDHCHGRHALGEAFAASRDVLRLVARPGEEPDDARGLMFIDVETTGLAGGTGTYAFLVGVGALEDDRFVVTQYFMRDFDEEPALLAALAERLARVTGLVTFNGSGFDLPLLETRFVLARRRWPSTLAHVDLLRAARRVWVACLPDCRLGTVEEHALGLTRDGDVPGAMIPALYFQFLRTRRPGALGRVFVHNRDDVLSLVALLGWFQTALARGLTAPLAPAEHVGIGRLLEPVDPERSLAHYRMALDSGRLTGFAWLWTCLRLAAWEKRSERWDRACALWEAASRSSLFDPRPWEELAKYHEHRRRDLTVARRLVRSALDLATSAGASGPVLERFAHRLDRLDRRLSSATIGAGLRG